jgi:hypothetical protein
MAASTWAMCRKNLSLSRGVNGFAADMIAVISLSLRLIGCGI